MIRKELKDLDLKIFEKFDKDWALLTAGDFENRNTMTVSWGLMGTIWNKSVVVVFVRPTRYTFKQMEISDRFTLSFMDESHKKQMAYIGSHSGLNENKYEKSGLVPVYDNDSFVSYIKDSQIVLKCKTLYSDYLKEDMFKDKGLFSHYDLNIKDFHKFYIAEVTSLLVKEDEE